MSHSIGFKPNAARLRQLNSTHPYWMRGALIKREPVSTVVEHATRLRVLLALCSLDDRVHLAPADVDRGLVTAATYRRTKTKGMTLRSTATMLHRHWRALDQLLSPLVRYVVANILEYYAPRSYGSGPRSIWPYMMDYLLRWSVDDLTKLIEIGAQLEIDLPRHGLLSDEGGDGEALKLTVTDLLARVPFEKYHGVAESVVSEKYYIIAVAREGLL